MHRIPYPGILAKIFAQSQMAVVVQTTWNDPAICQVNRCTDAAGHGRCCETVIRCVFIRPFKKLSVHIGMGCNGVAVNLAHIGVNGSGQMIGLLKVSRITSQEGAVSWQYHPDSRVGS